MSEESKINEKYLVRIFNEEDYNEIVQLWEKTGISNPERADDITVIKSTLKKDGVFFVLERMLDRKILGTAWITNDGRRLYLHHFCVHPDYQNKGLGKLLCEKCIEFGKQKNLQMKLEVHRTNVKAISLYKKYMFKELGDYIVMIIRKYE